KRIHVETDTEILFNITFRVDCIFKGQNIENRIEIIETGIKEGRIACQRLDPGKFYVVFLEKCATNMNIYCSLDFQERLVDDLTLELLKRTYDDINLKIKPKGIFYDFINTNMKSLFNNDNQFHRQSNITIVKDQSLINQYEDNPRSYACLSTLNSVWIISLVLNTLMFI
ncbi:unnamed protein product, partial [Rotaria sp. Silwood2]